MPYSPRRSLLLLAPDAAAALQGAQRAAVKEFPHPFAWAAFGLTGVGR